LVECISLPIQGFLNALAYFADSSDAGAKGVGFNVMSCRCVAGKDNEEWREKNYERFRDIRKKHEEVVWPLIEACTAEDAPGAIKAWTLHQILKNESVEVAAYIEDEDIEGLKTFIKTLQQDEIGRRRRSSELRLAEEMAVAEAQAEIKAIKSSAHKSTIISQQSQYSSMYDFDSDGEVDEDTCYDDSPEDGDEIDPLDRYHAIRNQERQELDQEDEDLETGGAR